MCLRILWIFGEGFLELILCCIQFELASESHSVAIYGSDVFAVLINCVMIKFSRLCELSSHHQFVSHDYFMIDSSSKSLAWLCCMGRSCCDTRRESKHGA